MRSEFYKHGYEHGQTGEPMRNPYELEDHKHQYEQGWIDGITDKLDDLMNERRAKLLDKRS